MAMISRPSSDDLKPLQVQAALENFARHLQERNGQQRLDPERPKRWTQDEKNTLRAFMTTRGGCQDCPKTPESRPRQCNWCASYCVCAARLLPGREPSGIKQQAYRMRKELAAKRIGQIGGLTMIACVAEMAGPQLLVSSLIFEQGQWEAIVSAPPSCGGRWRISPW